MNKYFSISIIMAIVIAMSACIEDLGVFKGRSGDLIIEGVITNEYGPHVIRLAMTREYNTAPDYTPVQQASLTIESDLGETIVLENGWEGVYETPASFRGEVGRSYKLNVQLRDGKKYQSAFEPLVAVPEIGGISYKQEALDVLSDEDVLTQTPVVTLSVDFKDDDVAKNYYRWRYLETYEIIAPLAGALEGGGLSRSCSATKATRNCWVDNYDREFLKVESDDLFNGQDLKNFEILSTEIDRKFDIGYSAEIQQYSLSERAFNYWNAIQVQIDNNGTLFETSNYQIEGNLYSLDDDQELVLGYFGASAVSRERILLIDNEVQFTYTYACEPNEGGCYPDACIDCRAYNTTSRSEMPSYWIK